MVLHLHMLSSLTCLRSAGRLLELGALEALGERGLPCSPVG